MLIELDLSKYKKARVWVDELPLAEYAADDHLLAEMVHKEYSNTWRHAVGVELYVPLGARLLWGIVGATFKEQPTGRRVFR